jgi:hypothetical protein
MYSVDYYDSKTNKYGNQSLTLKIGNSLKKCACTKKTMAGMEGNDQEEKNCERFINSMESEWADEISSSSALSTLHENKFNAPRVLPLTSDVTKLHKYLEEKRTKLVTTHVTSVISKSEWHELAQVALAQVIVFNRRRSGEAQRLQFSKYVFVRTYPRTAFLHLQIRHCRKNTYYTFILDTLLHDWILLLSFQGKKFSMHYSISFTKLTEIDALTEMVNIANADGEFDLDEDTKLTFTSWEEQMQYCIGRSFKTKKGDVIQLKFKCGAYQTRVGLCIKEHFKASRTTSWHVTSVAFLLYMYRTFSKS